MREDLLEKIRSLVYPVVEDFKLELVDLEYKQEGRNMILRIYIDKEGGVTLDDCAKVSREIGDLLEVEDAIQGNYHLEVSSPGIDRPLKKSSDYDRFAGRKVKIKVRELMDPDGRGHRRKTFAGKLLGLENGSVKVLQLDKKGGEVLLPLEEIEKANLDFEF